MLNIKVWKAQRDIQLACGHTLKAGQQGYILSLFVCAQDAACFPQAIQACI
ncbi:MAG: hypothetical protein U0350_43265 [Caldilineaceae bacterium]